MSLAVLLSLFGVGAAAGMLSGLMGIGGGMLLVPFLVAAFAHEGYPSDVLIKMAISTSLATILFTSLASLTSHHRLGGVRWPVVRALTPGIVLGVLLGTQLVGLAPAILVAASFALFLLFSAWRLARADDTWGPRPAASHSTPFTLASVGVGVGFVSSIVGAGGGFMTVPWLVKRGMQPARAVGSSAACGLPIAIAGVVGYGLAGLETNLPGPVIGFLHLPALFAIAAAGILTAPWGARLAARFRARSLKRFLALLLVMLATATLLASV